MDDRKRMVHLDQIRRAEAQLNNNGIQCGDEWRKMDSENKSNGNSSYQMAKSTNCARPKEVSTERDILSMRAIRHALTNNHACFISELTVFFFH